MADLVDCPRCLQMASSRLNGGCWLCAPMHPRTRGTPRRVSACLAAAYLLDAELSNLFADWRTTRDTIRALRQKIDAPTGRRKARTR